MNIRCPNCQTVFRVDPSRIPAGGVRARCSKCAATFQVSPDGESAGTARPSASAPPAAPASARPEAARPPADASAPPAEQAPARPRSESGPPLEARRAAGEGERTSPSGAPQQPVSARSDAPSGPDAAPTGQSAPARQPTGPMMGGHSSERAESPAPTATAPRPGVFGSRDPNARAQRIARALVSDIVAYHPDRRDACLAAGTLRTEFRDEILKSWEEYVAQVGEPMAKSTPYFRNALNDILAKGQSVF